MLTVSFLQVALWTLVLMAGACRGVVVVTFSAVDQGLEAIPDGIPQDVQTLRLYRNSFSEIDSFPFYPNLTRLLLYENQLEEFPNVVNLSLTLEELDVKKNKISYVDPDILGSLSVLKTLFLEYNKLHYLPDIPEPRLSSLEVLKLDFNSFYELPLLPRLGQSILTFSIGGNFIREIGKDQIAAMPNLINFAADSNPLESLRNLGLVGSTLMTLSLFGCRIRQINGQDLRPFEKLTYVALYLNQLEQVPDFRQSPSKATVQTLFLNNNRIRRVHLDRLSGMTQLLYLFLGDNELDILPNWCRLERLPLFAAVTGNDLTCDRRLRWTKKAKSAGMTLWLEHQFYPCASPVPLAGMLFSSIPESDLGETGKCTRWFVPEVLGNVMIIFAYPLIR